MTDWHTALITAGNVVLGLAVFTFPFVCAAVIEMLFGHPRDFDE